MIELDALISALPARPDPRELVRGFVPPARFAAKSFEEYAPRHPTQESARDRLEALTRSLSNARGEGLGGRIRALVAGRPRGGGVYLDGGFGVGKTHLLAALWNAAPAPKSYLSFDQLVHFIGLVGLDGARTAFSDRRLIAIDEWELDDPGNLKIALAFLRGAVADGVRLAVTSNTLPLELGAGRFSQKDFRSEIEELAAAFEVIRIEGVDYRHRHFEADPGREYFEPADDVARNANAAGGRVLLVEFPRLLAALEQVHPIRYAALATAISALAVVRLHPVVRLPEALRCVHFIDALYDSGVPLSASSDVPLGELFPPDFLTGPFGKKMSRCLSRMEELLGEAGRAGV